MRQTIMLNCLLLLLTYGMVNAEQDSTRSENLDKVDDSLFDYIPEMVGTNIISRASFEGHACITPDGNEIYFAIYSNDHAYSTIAYSIKKEGDWTEPEIVNFSGKYNDGSPALSPDGNKLFFSSYRPVDDEQENISSDLWYVEREAGKEWGVPVWLSSTVNTEFTEFSPSVDQEGNLFFCSNRPGGHGKMDVYFAAFNAGIYQDPLLLDGAVNSRYNEGNVGVSPDGKLLFFMVQYKPGDYGYDDIHYSSKRGLAWSVAKNIGPIVNTYSFDFSPKVSPDGQTLYFASRITRDFNSTIDPYTYKSFQDLLKSPLNGFGNVYRIRLDELNLQVSE